MRSPRTGLSVLVAAVLALSACTSSESGGEPAASTAPVTVTYAHEQEFQSYNNNTSEQSSVGNAVVLNQVLRGFYYYSPQGEVAPDDEFGTFTKVSDNPLTVKYTVDPKAVWSDGAPIECSDFVLTWAAQSGKWPAFQANGNAGYDLARMPQCNPGDKSFTVVFNTPFADWNSLFGDGEVLPAHVVERESGVPDLIAALKADDEAKIKKVASFWFSGWVFKPGQYDAAVSPSAGPYEVSAWEAGQSITLTANPKWWGTPPQAKNIVIRFIQQDQQAQALQNGEIQVMDPQPNPELLGQLDKLGASATVTTNDRLDWEHLDVNYTRMFKDAAVREAFAKCIPRQTIVDNLIKPLNPQAQVLESRQLLPFQKGYATLAATGGQAYDTVDIPGAKKLLADAGRTGLKVTIGYQTPNPRRASEVDLIRDSCAKAGFTIKDGGAPDFFDHMTKGDFDVALFAWSGTALVSQNQSIYAADGGTNFTGYDNAEVTAWLKQLNGTLDERQQLALQQKIETQLWKDLATIPLFAFPGVLAVAKNVQGVQFNASNNGLTWNADRWSLAG
ncbi:ABC transporter family substrate-binding protein [Spongisporangium articulatum]|uniref:ABC transporter family substrate-binding protein n=1 Tax=Spongisporangium articulatum TaxID=3362603 RepID=A0ABW8AQC1_9ACTN